jgi:hypothetical protein
VLAQLLNWNTRNSPPLSDRELATIVRSIATKETKKAEKKPLAMLQLDTFMSHYADERVQWLVPEWLPQGGICFVVAPPGSYKTWMLLDLVISVASGEPFLGRTPVHGSGPVLLFQQEDNRAHTASRLAAIYSSRLGYWPESESGEIVAPRLGLPIFIHPGRELRLDNDSSLRALHELVDRVRPALVVIDPLYSAVSADDYMAAAAKRMMALKTMRDTFGCSFVLAHHTRKKNDEGRQGAWGSQFINAFIETGWQLRKAEDEEHVHVHRHHKSSGMLKPLTLTFDIETEGRTRYAVSVEEVESIGTATPEAILAALINQPSTNAELARVLGVHKSTISRRLTGMSRDGMICKGDDSRWQPTTPTF